jgi:1-acyl-sn-glycerol-3-phosphate acyltransferase
LTDLPNLSGVRAPRRAALHYLRWALALAFHVLYDLHFHDQDKVPRKGPVIFAPNHVGFLDGPLLAICGPRPVHALTKHELFDGAMGVFLRASGQIRLDRFVVDPGAVKTCLKVLDGGGAVCIFPEGTRGDGELRRMQHGAAYLALVTGAPVVPVTFLGTRLPGSAASFPPRRSRFDVVYGDPVYWEKQPWPRSREDVQRATDRLAQHLRAHLDAAKALTGRSLPGPIPAGQEEA